MDANARKIARRILLAHLALLVGVLVLVYFASREIYNAARQQAIQQAIGPQERLAAQASRSIEDFYSTIISDMELARRSEADAPATQPAKPAAPLRRFYPYLWNQLDERVSALFTYDRKLNDPGHGVLTLVAPEGASPALADEVNLLANSASDWLNKVKGAGISRVYPLKSTSLLRTDSPIGGVNLVCVAPFEAGRRLLVAVVPAGEVQTRFLPGSSERKNISTTFMDENLQVIASSSPAMFGTNLKEIDDPSVRQLMKDFTTNPLPRTQVFDQPMSIAGVALVPRLITVEPVLIAGNRWPLLITSPMSDVDAVVNDVFRTALYWAAFVVVSVTAILISTARWMIRGRLRLERIQHELLAREVSQARQIQLNWLPSQHSAGQTLDIAAMNHPANHISGDFYNWFALPDGRQVITIGDVTGHGMAAAFLMATTQMLVRITMPRVATPGECLEEVNRQLCTQAFRGQFVTMLIIVLDIEKRIAEVATAGHHPPLVSHGGPFAALPLKSQLVLAVDEDQRYATERFELGPKTSMLLFTDGVVDAQNNSTDRFDPQGLQKALERPFAKSQEMIDAIVAAVTQFRGGRELDDDLTLVGIQLMGVVDEVNAGAGLQESGAVN